MGDVERIHAGGVVDDDLPLIIPGEYSLKFRGHSTWMMFGRKPKLILEFEIVDDEIYSGVVLNKYYKALKGRQGRNGNFAASRKSNFMRDFFRICTAYPPKRLDRIPMSRLEGVDILGTVKTVTNGHDQKLIPEPLQYSVFERLYR